VRALLNSALEGLSVTLLALLLGATAAYALARLNFRGRSFMLYLILSLTVFPQIAVLGALYELIRAFHLYDTLYALIPTYLLFTLPFAVWNLSIFFRGVPQELEDAAYVDGASPFQTFYRVMMPLAVPGIVTTSLLTVIAAWNEFLYALSFEFTPNHYTAALFIAESAGGTEIPWGPVTASIVVVEVPIVILILLFQRGIIAGLTSGAVKG
jgi:trehalose/maltose transport system permease protein